jgi:thiol-disulfide isomerase/thioredoxin
MKRRASLVVWVALLLAGCSSLNQGQYDGIERGWVGRSIFEKSGLAEWKAQYDTTHVAPEMIELLRQVHSGVNALVFFGTWCPDSKREVPRFLKIADLVGIARDSVKLYGLDRSKTSPDGLTEKYAITRVPTFIFLKNAQEVGRITEFPQTTLEGDILKIFAEARSK